MKKELLILKDYAEGKIKTQEFWELYQSNPKIAKLFIKDKTINFETYFSPSIIETHFNPEDVFERFGLYEYVRAYLIRHKIKCDFFNEDEKYISLINKIQPKYVDIRDTKFWSEILENCPSFPTQKEKIANLKKQVKDLFKYNTFAPKWIQPPEWPLENNKPLVFIKEEVIDDGFKYTFLNDETKEIRIIEQYY